jgi:isopentenyl-diphosphate delta-isomerase
MNSINLVDEKGNRIGSIEKLEAHRTGELHEAFSVFVFNKNKELLLQKRNVNKYHSGGLWSNTCCSHPEFNESIEYAIHRRLKEEVGFDCELKLAYSFIYKVNLENNLIENELDYVYIGQYNGNIYPNKQEVSECKWIKLDELERDIKQNPNSYTEWFKIILNNKNIIDYVD